jgi:hypothetical protein
MSGRWVLVVVAAASFDAGCAHVHRVGRPPTADEIAEINRSAANGTGTLTVHAVEPLEGLRPVPDAPPSEFQRIASVDGGQLTVVARTGEVQQLALTRVAGVTTRHRATFAGGLAGALLGFVVVSVPSVLYFYGSDSSLLSGGQSGTSAKFYEIAAASTAVGAVVGALVGHHVTARDSFEIGDTGLASEPGSAFSR